MGGFTIPAGTDLTMSAERYDAITERGARDFAARFDNPYAARRAERAYRKIAAWSRSAHVRERTL